MGLHLSIPEISTDKGLFTLLIAPGYFGEVTLAQPILSIAQPTAYQPEKDPPKKDSSAEEAQQIPISWWEQRSVRLRIDGGVVRSEEHPGNTAQILAQDLSLDGDLAAGTVNYRLTFQGDQTGGEFHAEGFLNLPIAGQPFFSSLVSQSTVSVHAMEIEPILSVLAGLFPRVPQGHGTLNGEGTLYMAGIKDLDIKGEALLESLELSGGGLEKDQPRFKRAQLVFAGKRHPFSGWHLSRLDLTSKPLSFTAKGILDQQHVDLRGQGRAELPLLSAALPHLLAIHQATRVDKGSLNFFFQAQGKPSQIELQATCETRKLELTQDAQVYRWEEPLSLQLQALVLPPEVQLRALALRAPFLEIKGEGEAKNFRLRASADLNGFFSELDKLFALPLHARGQLTLSMASQRMPTGLITRSSDLQIENFELKLHDQPLMPQHALTVQAQLSGAPGYTHWQDLFAGELKVKGWPGAFSLTLRQGQENSLVSPQKDKGGCQLDMSMNLARVQSVVEAWTGQQRAIRLEGRLEALSEGRWLKNRVHLHEVTGHIDHLALVKDGLRLFGAQHVALSREQTPLHLGTMHLGPLQVVHKELLSSQPPSDYCSLNLWPLRLDLNHLRLRSPQMTADLGLLTGSNKASRLSLNAVSEVSLLAPWWRQQGWLDASATVHGRAKGSVIVKARNGEHSQTTEVTLSLKNFQVEQNKEPVLVEPEVHLACILEPRAARERSYTVTALKLQSTRGTFTGAGLAHYGRVPTLLELHGELHPTEEWTARLLDTLISSQVYLTQIDAGSIFVSLPLHLPLELNQLTLSGELPVHGLGSLGVRGGEAILAVELNRSILRAQVREGNRPERFFFRGEWHQDGDGYILTIPEGTQLLEQLPLTREVADGFLAQLAPFGTLLTATGRVGLRVKRFSLTLNKAGRRPDFNLILDLRQAHPHAVGALKQLLDTAGLGTASLRFLERELVCEGWNGSMTCAPLRLRSGSADLVITGSKRRNGRINYAVKLPVTQPLLKHAGISALGQFSAIAEISGTQSRPIFHPQEFFQGLAAQITASLPKPLSRSEPEEPAQ